MSIKWFDWLYEFRGRNSIRGEDCHNPSCDSIYRGCEMTKVPLTVTKVYVWHVLNNAYFPKFWKI